MHQNFPERHSDFKNAAGATLVEYSVVMLLLGFVIYGTVAYFQPQSEQFHLEMKAGLGVSYPSNFIPEPTAIVVTAVPTAPVADLD